MDVILVSYVADTLIVAFKSHHKPLNNLKKTCCAGAVAIAAITFV